MRAMDSMHPVLAILGDAAAVATIIGTILTALGMAGGLWVYWRRRPHLHVNLSVGSTQDHQNLAFVTARNTGGTRVTLEQWGYLVKTAPSIPLFPTVNYGDVVTDWPYPLKGHSQVKLAMPLADVIDEAHQEALAKGIAIPKGVAVHGFVKRGGKEEPVASRGSLSLDET